MANEYKLSYTAAEINNKLGQVEQLSEEIDSQQLQILSLAQGAPPYAESLDWLEENGDIGKLYVLANGNLARYGEMENGGALIPNFTNLFDPSKAILNKRVNSSGALADCTGHAVSNFMDVSNIVPVDNNWKMYFKGASLTGSYCRLLAYKTTDGNYGTAYNVKNGSAMNVIDEGDGVYSTNGHSDVLTSGIKNIALVLEVSSSTITEADIQDIVVTINEPITYSQGGSSEGWMDTGVKYANYVMTSADAEVITDKMLDRLDISYVSSDKVLTVGTYTFRYDGVGIADIGVSE